MEQWKQIQDYPDYEISTEGRVRSNKKGAMRNVTASLLS